MWSRYFHTIGCFSGRKYFLYSRPSFAAITSFSALGNDGKLWQYLVLIQLRKISQFYLGCCMLPFDWNRSMYNYMCWPSLSQLYLIILPQTVGQTDPTPLYMYMGNAFDCFKNGLTPFMPYFGDLSNLCPVIIDTSNAGLISMN